MGKENFILEVGLLNYFCITLVDHELMYDFALCDVYFVILKVIFF